MTTGKHASATLFGAVAPATGQIVIIEADQATAETFQTFLETLRATFPDKTVHLVLDNAKIHHAKVLQPYLEDHPELNLRFLPPYSPNLNNTERLWKWLREKVILNTYFPDLEAIRRAIARFRDYLTTVPEEIQSRLGRVDPVSGRVRGRRRPPADRRRLGPLFVVGGRGQKKEDTS